MLNTPSLRIDEISTSLPESLSEDYSDYGWSRTGQRDRRQNWDSPGQTTVTHPQ